MIINILSEDEVHTGSFAFMTGRPDISTMIFYDCLYNGQSDAASAMPGISGRICSVESVENIRNILLRNSLAVIFNFNPDGINFIQNPDINLPGSVIPVQIFDTVADNVVDDTLELFGISNDYCIR